MKRFHWPLQKLLEVTAQRELALRGELLALTQELARCRGQILAAQAQLRDLLDQVAAQEELSRRIRLQQLLLDHSRGVEEQIKAWGAQLKQLQQARTDKMHQLQAAKRKRQSLERLREGALGRYRQELERSEQAGLDESAIVSFARRMPPRRTSIVGAR